MNVQILIDSREQIPYSFGDMPTVSATLDQGDYSVAGLADRLAIERKSLSDFVSCIGPERDRFKRELVRLRGLEHRAVVIETTLGEIEQHQYRSKTTPQSVVGSILSWQMTYGVPFVLAGDRARGEDFTRRMLVGVAKRYLKFAKRIQHHKAKGPSDVSPAV